MSALAKHRLSAAEYLEIERRAEYKSEFYGGEIFGMAGGTEAHALISSNVVGTLRELVARRGCRVYTSDMRILVEASGLYTYPDVSVTCQKPQFEDASRDTLLNPLLIVEVLSPSTEAYDRGAKFRQYSQIPGLLEYVLVSPNDVQVERYLRTEDGEWTFRRVTERGEALHLRSVDCELRLEEVYLLVEFVLNPSIKSN